MTTVSDPRSGLPGATHHVFEEPAIKPPPMLTVGPLAWVRNNLFRSAFDTVLTVVFAAVAVSVIVGTLNWVITEGNWFVITKNLRQFMVGFFPQDAVWRVEWMVIYLAFLIGFSIATWSRVSRIGTMIIAGTIALTFIIPVLTNNLLPPANSYMTAGNIEIESGSITETPIPQVGFIGRAGETIRISIAAQSTDPALTQVAGFTDRASDAIVNAARNRLETEEEIRAMQARLDANLLTEAQRTEVSEELASIDMPPPVSETLSLNTEPVRVEVLRGSTFEVLAETTLDDVTDELTLTLPEDGWYIINKTLPENAEAVALLRVNNVAPLLISEFSPQDIRYRRLSDDFETRETRPRIDGGEVPANVVTQNQYRGERNLSEFLRLHLGPILEEFSLPLLIITLAATVGYWASRVADRMRPTPRNKQKTSMRVVTLLWTFAPIIIYALLSAVSTNRWGGLLLTFMLTVVGIVASFPIGVLLALGRRSNLPVVSGFCTLFIEFVRGVPLVSVLFMANLMLPLLNPALATIDGVIRAMAGITLFSAAYLAENVRGGLQSIPPGQEEAAKAVGLNSVQITLFIMLPQALRAVIPALVGQAISLFKDTSLVYIVGLFDLLKIADTSIAQPEFIGARPETYLFISLFYFGFSYVMGYISLKIEETGSGAARRV